jgi:hypothetical protein
VAVLPLGATAIEKIPEITTAMVEAAGAAFVQSYLVGLRHELPSFYVFGVRSDG